MGLFLAYLLPVKRRDDDTPSESGKPERYVIVFMEPTTKESGAPRFEYLGRLTLLTAA
jgi:hypothetical protein